MILQALVQHYETLLKLGRIAPPGWSEVKVSYALCLNGEGQLLRTVCLKTEQTRGKKTVLAPQLLRLPAPVKRASGISPNFICDNSTYMLGVDNKGKPARSMDCFHSCGELHQALLGDTDSPTARAILAFFQNWDPEKALEHPALAENLEEILAGANLVFRVDDRYAHEDPLICQAWDQHYGSVSDGPEMVCLVTGKKCSAGSIHPSVKNVVGAQSSGAALVSFNAPAFWSYGKEYNLNAPVSQYAAFAYTTALNHLLADRAHVCRIGDATVVYWAENGSTPAQNIMGGFCFGQPTAYSESDLFNLVRHLCRGESVTFEEEKLDPNMEFYVLGLSPNAARLSVRFFLRNSLGGFLRNTMAHHKRMEIVRPAYDKFPTLPLWKVLDETVRQHAQSAQSKVPAPNLAGDTLRAILNDAPYPATLLNGVRLRIRAEQEVTRGRAAIVKAYYKYFDDHDIKISDIPDPKEVLTVSLNPDSTSVPYTLGRLFSLLETIQSTANPGINTTIKDRYFNSASASPAHVFPTLVNLAQKHLKKLKNDPKTKGLAISYDKKLTELMGKLDESYPSHLSIPQQGVFQLGYYHQTQYRYESKNKEEN